MPCWRFFAAKNKSAAQNDMPYDKNRLRVFPTRSLFRKWGKESTLATQPSPWREPWSHIVSAKG
jgi:hypothetical protein